MWIASGVCPRTIGPGAAGGEVQRRVAVAVAGVQVLGEPRQLGERAQHVEVALLGGDVQRALLVLAVAQRQDAGGRRDAEAAGGAGLVVVGAPLGGAGARVGAGGGAGARRVLQVVAVLLQRGDEQLGLGRLLLVHGVRCCVCGNRLAGLEVFRGQATTNLTDSTSNTHG
ncbi:hypothetical protein ON010_g19105 [Phytophthora cinnamomi]|nr:hypothetical protein ON010_g19105 [Phytophthora cinnamomi]